MPRRPSPAQIAHRLTWQLEGYIKRIQLMYILAGVQLAKIRDEQHWKALRHPTIEDWAQKRLGLSRAALYHYLQVHDWLKRDHPAWLAPKPKGFIPPLTGASALMWIEKKLRVRGLSESLRKDLAAMRAQALRGTLTDDEFRALRARVRGEVEPLRAMLARLKSLRRETGGVTDFPADAREALDEAIRAVERALGSNRETAKLLGPREIMLARRALESGSVIV
jgi:hypothetical protein